MKKVLVVDDEPMSHQLVSAVLRVLGDLEIQQAHTGSEGLAKAQADPPDLIITDINMPDMDGLTLCTRIRETPALADALILLLTARGDPQDKYEGFLLGADDYMTKPFDVMELQLRIKALLRRTGGRERREAEPAGLAAAGIALEPAKFLARLNDKEVRLTGTELAIMKHFVAHPDQVISAEQLLNQALDYPTGVGNPQVIHTHLKNIRGKFRAAGAELVQLTSSWQGYMLETQLKGAP